MTYPPPPDTCRRPGCGEPARGRIHAAHPDDEFCSDHAAENAAMRAAAGQPAKARHINFGLTRKKGPEPEWREPRAEPSARSGATRTS